MTTGTGASSAQQAVGQQHSELNSVSDLCVVSASRPEDIEHVGDGRHSLSGMTHEEWGAAIERALAAAKSHLNEWQFSGDVTRLWAADRHIKHLIALSRMEPVQPRSQA